MPVVPAWAADDDPLPTRLVMGHSRKGVPIVAKRQGPADAERVLLIEAGRVVADGPPAEVIAAYRRLMT